MRRVVVEVGEDGRIVTPSGKRLRLSAEALEEGESEQAIRERQERLQALFHEIDARLDQEPRKPWPKDDPIVEKFRRMGVLEED